MNDVEAIQAAIERLTSRERAGIAQWLRLEWGETGNSLAEAAAKYGKPPAPRRMSVEEYLAFEEASQIRHEYVGGEIFAMSGATLRHNAISCNLLNAFSMHLRGKPCRAFINDVKVRLQFNRDEIFYYPDVLVACGKLELDSHYLREPKLIVEVLSPSTQMTDRREKALHYRQVDALEEYVLVAQNKREVTRFRRQEGWTARLTTREDEAVEFGSIGLTVPLARIYEGVF